MASRKKRADGKTGRLSLRLRDEQYVKDVHDLAKRRKTTITKLVEELFDGLLTADRNIIELEQG